MKTYANRFLFCALTVSGLLLSGNIAPFFTSIEFVSVAQAQTTYTDSQIHQWLENTGNEMVSVVNSSLSKQEQKSKFETIIAKNVDVNLIAKFCLGRFWRAATPTQQKEYTDLFHKVLINAITDRLGEYKGVSFTIGKINSLTNGNKSVETILKRPGQPDIAIQWVISTKTGSPKIIDIIGENASLSVTQRGDYTSFITRHANSIDALLDALKKQISRHP